MWLGKHLAGRMTGRNGWQANSMLAVRPAGMQELANRVAGRQSSDRVW